MWDLDNAIDRSPDAPPMPFAGMAREWLSLATYFPGQPSEPLPRGDGHCVLVIPGILSSGWTTAPFRKILTGLGYHAPDWGLGMNFGPTDRIRDGLRRRVDTLRAESGRTISVIGISLGGLLALDLVYDRPEAIRQLITLVSPRRLPVATVYRPLVRLMHPFFSDELDFDRLKTPIPAPALSLYTSDDEILDWRARLPLDPTEPAIDVHGPHQTVCRTPAAQIAVAKRLAEVGEG